MATLPVLLFSNFNKLFVGFFDPKNIFLNHEINEFQGDLTDTSEKTKPLDATRLQILESVLMFSDHTII